MAARGDKRPGGSVYDSNVSSCKKRRRFLELYRQLEEPDFHDAFILVLDHQSGRKTKLKVHKAMVLAASEVLRTQFSSRWDPLKDPVIQLPEEYSVQAATTFIKLLYMDIIDARVSLETVLQVVALCDMYMIEDAMEICNDFVITKIAKDNCLLIHEKYEGIHVGNPSPVISAARKIIAENITDLITSPSAVESWPEAYWKTVLNLESPHLVETGESLELKLFQQLLKWKKVNLKARKTIFHNAFLPLIRFPLMKSKTLAEKVVPTGVLSAKDIMDLFCYNSQSTDAKSQGKRKPRFPAYSRTIKFAKNTKEMETLLNSANPHDNILLSPGDFSFSPSFGIYQNKVKISGSGNLKTRLICSNRGGWMHESEDYRLAKTSDSTITNLQFICTCPKEQINEDEDEDKDKRDDKLRENIKFIIQGSRNQISKIETNSCTIEIRGNFNCVSHSILKNNREAVRIEFGKRNVLKDLTILSVKWGIVLLSGYNIVEDVFFEKACYGIDAVNSSYGEFKNITFKFERRESKLAVAGITISGGSYNKIRGLNCSRIHSVGEDDKIRKTYGVRLFGKGRGNEVTDFVGNSLDVGLGIGKDSTKNIVNRFKIFNSLISVMVTDSEGNRGKNIECEYSSDLFKVFGKHVVAFRIEGGKGNVFDDVQIITQNHQVEESGDSKEQVSKFLQNPILFKGGDGNVIRFRDSSA